MTSSACLNILCRAANLIHGTFDILTPDATISIAIPPLVHLQSLTLFKTGAERILNSLTAPALKTLKLRPHDMHHPAALSGNDAVPFLSLLARSSFQLHTLVLADMAVTTDALIECLNATPTVVHLKLIPIYLLVDMDTVFARFTRDPGFLPRLESLHTAFTTVAITPLVVVEFLCWGWGAGEIAQLRSFWLLHTGSEPDFDEAVKSHPNFRRLEAEGLGLYVRQEKSWPIFVSFFYDHKITGD
ncbi:hypothetical protein C8R43DRAFT_954244 [Mycena crocata]|nr:hypothetical protein C8R43DRAFT_954244 [Mycena crocata]